MFFPNNRLNNHNSEIKEEEDEQNDGSSAKKEEELLKFQNMNLKAADLGDEDEIPDEEDEEQQQPGSMGKRVNVVRESISSKR